MRLQATFPLALALVSLVSCNTTTPDDPYAKANTVMAAEIGRRVKDMEFQQRTELLDNLMWLAQTGEQSIPFLIEGLQNQSPKVRSNSAWVLGRIRDRRVIPTLQQHVNDSNQSVRLEVSRTLVLLGDMKQAPALIEGLDSDRVAVRFNCHQALKESTGRDFGYDHLAESELDRQKATLRWRQWWGEQFSDPWFAQSYAQAHGLDGQAGRTTGTPAMPMTEPMQQPTQQPAPQQPIEITPDAARQPNGNGQDGR